MAVRRLLPDPRTLALDELYAGLTLEDPAPTRGVHVALCMVASADGAVAVEGLSGGLGGEADLRALSRLRGANDVSLVGAGTVRDERYVPLTGSSERRADRRSRGLRSAPRLAIVTASGRLASDLDVFSDPDEPPIVLTSRRADRDALAAISEHAEVHVISEAAELDAETIVATLVELGLPRVLCEGGPQLNQVMLAGGRIDEVFLTVAPTLVGGSVPRIIGGGAEVATDLTLLSAHEHEGDLLLRYRRA